MKKAIIIAIVTSVIIYGLGLAYLYYSNESYEQEFALYDVNKNGVIDKEELTLESQNITAQGAKRKTIKEGAIVLIPFSLFIGAFAFAVTFLFGKIKTINDNEIIKSKSKQA